MCCAWIEIRCRLDRDQTNAEFSAFPPPPSNCWHAVPHSLLDRAVCIGARAIFDRTVLPRKPVTQTRSGGVGRAKTLRKNC